MAAEVCILRRMAVAATMGRVTGLLTTAAGFIARIWVVPEVVGLAFTLSLCTAVVSSFYPAFRASRLHVVDALRHI